MSTEASPDKSADPGAACIELINTSRVMTLGTAGAGPAECWTAPVYYLFADRVFYFFSSPDARHIREGINGTAGASVFRDAADATQLRGLQMSGRIAGCSPGPHAIKIAWAYCRRFGITCGTEDIIGFFASKYRARLYGFSPGTLLYMDNRLGMGTRTEIRL